MSNLENLKLLKAIISTAPDGLEDFLPDFAGSYTDADFDLEAAIGDYEDAIARLHHCLGLAINARLTE